MKVMDLTESRYGLDSMGVSSDLFHAHVENFHVREGVPPERVRLTWTQWQELLPCLAGEVRYYENSNLVYEPRLFGLMVEVVPTKAKALENRDLIEMQKGA